jgi:hypothetical protein
MTLGAFIGSLAAYRNSALCNPFEAGLTFENRSNCHLPKSKASTLGCLYPMLCFERNNDGHNSFSWSLCRQIVHWPSQWILHDFLPTLPAGMLFHSTNSLFHLILDQEVAPARYRGLALSCFQVWTSVGTLIGTIVDNFTSELLSRASYMIPLAIIYVVPAILAFGMIFIPESPRYVSKMP